MNELEKFREKWREELKTTKAPSSVRSASNSTGSSRAETPSRSYLIARTPAAANVIDQTPEEIFERARSAFLDGINCERRGDMYEGAEMKSKNEFLKFFIEIYFSHQIVSFGYATGSRY